MRDAVIDKFRSSTQKELVIRRMVREWGHSGDNFNVVNSNTVTLNETIQKWEKWKTEATQLLTQCVKEYHNFLKQTSPAIRSTRTKIIEYKKNILSTVMETTAGVAEKVERTVRNEEPIDRVVRMSVVVFAHVLNDTMKLVDAMTLTNPYHLTDYIIRLTQHMNSEFDLPSLLGPPFSQIVPESWQRMTVGNAPLVLFRDKLLTFANEWYEVHDRVRQLPPTIVAEGRFRWSPDDQTVKNWVDTILDGSK